MRIGLVLLLLGLLATGSATAATILVRQDGTGDHLTIEAAVAAASDGDVVLVGPGEYTPGFMQITFGLTFRSEAGSAATFIDGQGTSRIFWFNGAEGCALEGFTIRNAYMAGQNGLGCAAYLDLGATLSVSGCVFEDNRAGWDAGGVYARDSGTSVTITDCIFRDNFAGHNCAACGVTLSASMSISDCSFIGNTSYITGAVAGFAGATLNVEGCLFLRNEAVAAGALRFGGCTGQVRNNTFHANSSEDRATILLDTNMPVLFTGNIVTSDALGFGLEMGISCSHDGNIFFDNALGGLRSGTPSLHEFFLDPMYCDHPLDDFGLCSTSLGLPENNGWGLIGAFPQGCDSCGPIGVRDETWGGVKGLYED